MHSLRGPWSVHAARARVQSWRKKRLVREHRTLEAMAEGMSRGMENRNWYTATQPFRYTGSMSTSPRAFSLYTLPSSNNHKNTQ